jgi:hypothetical protein
LLTSALCKRHHRQECFRSAFTTKRGLIALKVLLILLALGVPASADDPIAEWLKQDEVDSQNDKVRPDLNALTDQQLQDIFRIGREQVDSPQLIQRGDEEHKSVLYIWIWLIAIAAGIVAMIAAVKARPFVRSQLRTLVRQHLKSSSVRSLDDLQAPGTCAPHRHRHLASRVSAVSKNAFDERE